MPELPIRFLNCHNFHAGSAGVAPQQKVSELANMLSSVSAVPPAFICLCEVAHPNLGQAVATAAFPNTSYGSVWSHFRKFSDHERGLVILYDTSVIDDPSKVVRDRLLRNDRQSSRWLAAKFKITALPQDPLWVIVNHWHSGFQNAYDGEYNRRRASDEISDLFRGMRTLRRRRALPILDQRSDKIVVLGDFNCEPTDRVFRLGEKGSWKVSPDVSAVLSAPATWPCFYNPMVKAPNIFGTFKSENRGLSLPMVDHILLSGTLCGPSGLHYQSASIVASRFQSLASDHAAIGAVLEY